MGAESQGAIAELRGYHDAAKAGAADCKRDAWLPIMSGSLSIVLFGLSGWALFLVFAALNGALVCGFAKLRELYLDRARVIGAMLDDISRVHVHEGRA